MRLLYSSNICGLFRDPTVLYTIHIVPAVTSLDITVSFGGAMKEDLDEETNAKINILLHTAQDIAITGYVCRNVDYSHINFTKNILFYDTTNM